MPRVLLVSYYYPPSGGSGVQRALKMSRYLPEFGWEVTVLTVDPAHAAYPDADPSMLADVPAGVAVERTRAWDPYAAYAHLLGKAKADAVGVGFANAGGAPSGKERLARWLRANVFLPDARVGWVPHALRRARALHAARPFDVVLTTAPPMSLHLVGLAFARATGVPWVADFRDPWTDVYFLRDLPRTALAARLDRALEAAVLRRATRAVAVSPSLARGLGAKVGRALDVIPNGFDEADFPDAPPAPAGQAFTLAYVGNFLGQQNPDALWRALARLRAGGELPAFRLRLVGNVDPAVAASLAAHGLDAVTERVPYVPHAAAVAEMRAAALLLLAINRVEGAEAIVTGKLFEYVASGRPVLGVGPAAGDAAAFLRETGAGELFDWDDEAGIEAFVRRHYAAWAAGAPLPGATPEAARPLTRRDQARQMGDVLRAAMASGSEGSAPVSRPKLLYVYLSPSSFVEDDRALLAERYDVRPFHFDARAAKGARGMAGMLARQAAWLRRELPGAHAVYGWFADYHLALPVWAARRAGVPVAVALGGFEANTLPALGYGVMRSPWRAPIARYVLRRAAVLLPVAGALVAHENRFGAWPGVLRNGVRAHVPALATPAVVVPTGYDPGAWPMGPDARPPSVLAAGFVADARGHRLKGLDHLLAAARRMPDVAFRAVGVAPAWADALRARGEVPANADLLPPRPRADLAALYADASVFACLSRSEGLPNVLCEAMLCGCVPVGSAVGGVPEVMGDAGFVAETPEPHVLDAALRAALAAPPEARRRARARIAERFSTDLRRARLFGALAGLTAR